MKRVRTIQDNLPAAARQAPPLLSPVKMHLLIHKDDVILEMTAPLSDAWKSCLNKETEPTECNACKVKMLFFKFWKCLIEWNVKKHES